MENENKWEYDYSSANSSSGDTGYPNVGSSGMNTANTAGTYSPGPPVGNFHRQWRHHAAPGRPGAAGRSLQAPEEAPQA